MFPQATSTSATITKEALKVDENWSVLELKEGSSTTAPIILFNPAGASGLW
jgi:hypothetical protein